MTDVAWNWLPDGALGAPPVLGALDRVVADWCDRWWTGEGLRRQRLTFGDAGGALAVVAQATNVSVRTTAAHAEALVGRALDIDLPRIEQGEGDRAVVDALADDMFRDLAGRLEGVLGGGVANDRSGPAVIEFTDEAGRRMLVVETSRAALAETRRGALPASRRDESGALTPLRAAIAEAPLTLDAIVGSVEIALPEARRLAPGDVIVLDRPLDQPLDLIAAAGGSLVACATLVDAASPRSLRLQAAAGRDHR